MFTIVVIFNIIAISLTAADVWDYPKQYIGGMVLGNLTASILVRNELFGRLLYLVVNKLFAKVSDACHCFKFLIYIYLKWSPLWFRLTLTSILQHLGGIHSACASSAMCWLIFKVTIDFSIQSEYRARVVIPGVLVVRGFFLSEFSSPDIHCRALQSRSASQAHSHIFGTLIISK